MLERVCPKPGNISVDTPSLCSSEGLSPASNITQNDSREETVSSKDNDEHKFQQVPRYAPYKVRSKQVEGRKVEQPQTPVSIANNLVATGMTNNNVEIENFQTIVGQEMDDFYQELLSQGLTVNNTEANAPIQYNNTDMNLTSVNKGPIEDNMDESMIDFDIIPPGTFSTGEMIKISDDELDEILNG